MFPFAAEWEGGRQEWTFCPEVRSKEPMIIGQRKGVLIFSLDEVGQKEDPKGFLP